MFGVSCLFQSGKRTTHQSHQYEHGVNTPVEPPSRSDTSQRECQRWREGRRCTGAESHTIDVQAGTAHPKTGAAVSSVKNIVLHFPAQSASFYDRIVLSRKMPPKIRTIRMKGRLHGLICTEYLSIDLLDVYAVSFKVYGGCLRVLLAVYPCSIIAGHFLKQIS